MAGEIDQHLAKRIRQARIQEGIGDVDAANALGMSEKTYSDLEHGRLRIRALYVARLARLLGYPVGWFYEGLPGQAVFKSSPRKTGSV